MKTNSLLANTIYKQPLHDSDRIKLTKEKWFLNILEKVKYTQRGIITVGPEKYGDEFYSNVIKLSRILKYPILADGCSQLRFLSYSDDKSSTQNRRITGSTNNIICNYEAMFRSASFSKTYLPEIILHFGRTLPQRDIEDFYGKHSPLKIMINEDRRFF